MSSEALSKLPTAAQELVKSTFGSGQATGSGSEVDAKAVDEWINKISGGSLVVPGGSLKQLDEALTPQTYLVGSQPTAADVALYSTLHPVVESLSKENASSLYTTPAVLRYFDHIQNLPSIRNAPAAPSLVPLDTVIESAPKLERKAPEPTKKKAKKDTIADAKTETAVSSDKAAASGSAPVKAEGSSGQPKEKKEKKGKKEGAAAAAGEPSGKKAAGGAAAPAADAGEPSPAMIDLRVGHIVDVKKHPDADGLYVEQIDLGEETGPRTIVSGLVNYIPIEQMQDKWLVVVANLKPANMRGVKSYGMVLCASHKDGKDNGIEIVDPPKGSKPGDRIYFEGEKYENVEPVSQLNPKKKIFETIQPNFTTLETKEAAWVDPETKTVHRLLTKLGPCTAPSIVGASLS
ncbi:G4 quadruplex nucleic acid binding protein [Tulasnella sp. 424]|nr:G4 quadruplex nucleic acid binding protein [Tulasnella sp. 424]KAG8980398.1 G4 quadruplex nucleic acid binding protein [Tulasnella sp. 425]